MKKKRQSYPETAADTRGGRREDASHKREPEHTEEESGDPPGPLRVSFFLFVVFSPLLLGHMLLTRFSAQEKRKSTEQWRWGTGARKSAGRGGKVVKPQDHTREQPARITRRMRGNTLSLEGEWGRSAVRTSAGWGICGRVLTCGRHGEAGLEHWARRSSLPVFLRGSLPRLLPKLHCRP